MRGKGDIRNLQRQMRMVGREDRGIEMKAILLLVVPQKVRIGLIVCCLAEDLLACVAAGNDMIKSSGIVDPSLARHADRLTQWNVLINT